MTVMLRSTFGIAAAAALLLGGCATSGRPDPSLPAAQVPAAAETAPVGTADADAADDPAIWVPRPGASGRLADTDINGLILGTDKKAGLYVFDLQGSVRQFIPDGLLNNVDLVPEGAGFVAAASDRGRMGVALYQYTGTGMVVPAGFIRSDVAEPYGLCMGMIDDAPLVALVAKDGAVRLYRVSGAGSQRAGSEIGRFKVATQSEGCAIDSEHGEIYVGEENRGLWRYSVAEPNAPPLLVSAVGDGALVADVEGVTLLQDGADRFLIASSQGDSAFAVWQLGGETPRYSGRFRVVGAGAVDGVSGTDGIAALGGSVGDYARGLVVVQDDANDGAAQNFKLVSWAAVRAALGL